MKLSRKTIRGCTTRTTTKLTRVYKNGNKINKKEAIQELLQEPRRNRQEATRTTSTRMIMKSIRNKYHKNHDEIDKNYGEINKKPQEIL
ncbi:hypothetical protein Glove_242g167 [Diversispora epigaea]|uniref:Uncharacterized protein n=1 Tax=Diversispora epigaea TaxID=1348612 RepID=A0A397IGT2_9GLOM|nr:hypothetical protein Glove_242g167 [Diversispora epigaea]